VFEFEDYIKFTVGEVVPAREGLRPASSALILSSVMMSERLFQLEKD